MQEKSVLKDDRSFGKTRKRIDVNSATGYNALRGEIDERDQRKLQKSYPCFPAR